MDLLMASIARKECVDAVHDGPEETSAGAATA